MDFIQFCHVNLRTLSINPLTSRTGFYSRVWIIYLQPSVICIVNENKEKYNVKTMENDVKYCNSNMVEMDKSRELYSREGDNSCQFEGKTVAWGHTIVNIATIMGMVSYLLF